jgi:hypothetical protein
MKPPCKGFLCFRKIFTDNRRGGIAGKVQGGYIVGEPKTVSSKHKIMLPQFVITALRVHQTRQVEMRTKAGNILFIA